jgi:hypothetical protein
MFSSLLVLGILGVLVSGAIMYRALRYEIAHGNILNAIRAIDGGRWDLVVRFTGKANLKWRFYGRPYMSVIALHARQMCAPHDRNSVSTDLCHDCTSQATADALRGATRSAVIDYLVSAYQQDKVLMRPRAAFLLLACAGGAFFGFLILLAYALAH